MGNGTKARYFDDYVVGEEWETIGRTITETDAVSWIYFTGEWLPGHVDEEFARAHGPFGKRLPPGLMTAAIALGLSTPLRIMGERGVVAFLELIVRYRKPVFIGDTVHARIKVAEKRPASRPDRGFIKFSAEVLNQNNDVVQEQEWLILVARHGPRDEKPSAAQQTPTEGA